MTGDSGCPGGGPAVACAPHGNRVFQGLVNSQTVQTCSCCKDPQLERWHDDTPESLSTLFDADVAGALDAARARHTDGLISLVFKATRPATTATAPSTCGQHVELYPSLSGCQPFHKRHYCFSGSRGHQITCGCGRPQPTTSASSRDATDTGV